MIYDDSCNEAVYFVEAIGLNKIKIGRIVYAMKYPNSIPQHINNRFQALKCASPAELRLLGYTTRFSEKSLHETFKDSRSHSEWFHTSDKLLKFIDAINESDSQPNPE